MEPQTALRIAIVGAGPSGLSLAWYLFQLGFRHVTIYDAAEAAGGQSQTRDIDGLPVELGTCYLTDGYVIAREMAAAAGTPPERLPPATFLDAHGKPAAPPMPALSTSARYLFHWFAWYLRGQLTAPSDPQYAAPFDAWLRTKGLSDLADSMVFADGCTAQLYGPLDAITAQNGLSWVRPSLLITGRFEHTAHLPAGFQTMWRRLAAHLGYRVVTGTALDEVRPVVVEGRQQVDLVRGPGPLPERYDHVFIAAPLDESTANAARALRHPLTAMLRDDFAPFDASEVYSAIWRGDEWPLAAPSRCYTPWCASGAPGHLLTIRQYGKTGADWVGQLCAYAIADAGARSSEERLAATREQVLRDIADLLKMRNVRIIEDRMWRYGIRFSEAQLRQGLPQAIARRQGEEHVWYTGGTLSHWDVDMIANFNQDLARRFARRVGVSWWDRLRIVRLRDLFKDL